ncbi:MAG: hypothetical protein HXY50_07785 [Ignavibacteriaceae bacterium]|nr:hypothetical protein [Ignavibacteriaceae bacterium]
MQIFHYVVHYPIRVDVNLWFINWIKEFSMKLLAVHGRYPDRVTSATETYMTTVEILNECFWDLESGPKNM